MDNEKLWNSVLVEMELAVSKANFNTWFKGTSVLRMEDGVVFVSVPNAFAKDWLFNKYHKSILKSLRTLSSSVRAVEYLVAKNSDAVKHVDGNILRPLPAKSPAAIRSNIPKI